MKNKNTSTTSREDARPPNIARMEGERPLAVRLRTEPQKRITNPDLLEAIEDVRLGRNLHGPYDTVEEAMAAMLED